MSDDDTYLQKGDWVSASWMQANDPPSCLAGMQMKIGAKGRSVSGTVTRILGDDPVNPKAIEIYVKPDDGGDTVLVRPEWVREMRKKV